jgi:hypothetical protein
MTPRARPKAKAPIGPSPAPALTLSTKEAVAWLAKMIEASSGALTARRPAGPVLKRRHVADFQGAGLVENREGTLYANIKGKAHFLLP